MTRLASRTARLREIEALLLLKPAGLRVTEIAEQVGVARRTIYRDLEFMGQQGIPIWQANGRYGISRTRYLTTIRLAFHEAMALVLAGLLLSRTIDERNPHVSSALRKLAVTFPNPLVSHLERAAERVQGHVDDSRQIAVLEAVAEGWGIGHKVAVEYRSPRSGSLRERVIAPYALEPTASGIYVICFDDWADDMRTFKLDRLEAAEVLDETFQIPAEFDLEEHLSSGWRIMVGDTLQKVILRFQPEVSAHVRERQWHPSQTLKMMEDGRCLLTVEVAEPLEMQPWIRSWGAQVEVLQPAWLREKIAEELYQAAQQYRGGQDVDSDCAG